MKLLVAPLLTVPHLISGWLIRSSGREKLWSILWIVRKADKLAV